jgi:hypothetical protein
MCDADVISMMHFERCDSQIEIFAFAAVGPQDQRRRRLAMGWLGIGLVVYLTGVFTAAAIAFLLAERSKRWTIGAGVVAAGLALTLLPGHPPFPMPVFLAVGLCAFRGCDVSADWWLRMTVLPLVVQVAFVVLFVSIVGRRRSG